MECRICRSTDLTDCINLGEQYITSRWPDYGDFSTPKTSIVLCLCGSCGLLQLRGTTPSSELYEHQYGYRSGISNTMRTHLKSYQEEILSKVAVSPGDMVVDIGSNDSTMLQMYSSELIRVGIDPTGSQFHRFYREVELIADYFTKATFQSAYGLAKPKIVSSIAMFYDLPDPVQFAKDIYDILHDDGIWTCEQSYLPSMLETNSVDTICHEHLEYYGITQVHEIAKRAGFTIVDISLNSSNGGSFRVYFKKSGTEAPSLATYLEKEKNLKNIATYTEFMVRVDAQVAKLRSIVSDAKAAGKECWIYGASTKGNCLLQYAGFKESDLPFAVERNLDKIGKMTSIGSKIISEDEMRNNPPAYLLVLPWHFRTEIIERESAYISSGGTLLFPLPECIKTSTTLPKY